MKAVLPFAVFIGLSFLAGALGGAVTAASVSTWYAELLKPSWTPPDAVFGPVWIMLYILMGAAAALVVRSGREDRMHPIALFLVQLFVNTVWSVIFFGLHDVWGAFVAVVVLWGLILWMIAWFSQYSKLAAALLVPYLLWVSYAAVLNGSIALLNT